MRTIGIPEIINNIKEMCIEANYKLTHDMECALRNAEKEEKSPIGNRILIQLQDNLEIA